MAQPLGYLGCVWGGGRSVIIFCLPLAKIQLFMEKNLLNIKIRGQAPFLHYSRTVGWRIPSSLNPFFYSFSIFLAIVINSLFGLAGSEVRAASESFVSGRDPGRRPLGSCEDLISSGAVLSLIPGSADLLWALRGGGGSVYGCRATLPASSTSWVGPLFASHSRKM